MKNIVSKSLLKAYTYLEYRKRIDDLLIEGKSSGNDQSEDLFQYSQLNATRMNRLDKTIAVSSENEDFLKNLTTDYIWLVLSEGWCGDAAQLLPIMNKMAQLSDKIDLQIVFRDENPELMDLFLTNGGKSIPKLIIIEKNTMEVVADWGPRPRAATELIKNYKEKHGIIDENAKTELQLWYLHDKGFSTQSEILALLKK